MPPNTSRLKLAIIAIVLGGLLASGLGLYYYVNSLKKEIATLQGKVNTLTANNSIMSSNNATLKTNLNVAVESNITNTVTIDALLKERRDAVEMVNKLAKTDLINKKKIKDLKIEVDKLKGNPAEDGPLAPVLRDTLTNVQNLE